MIKHMNPSNKFTPSPSSSNYKFTYNNTKNGLTSGCSFRRILRRIFCMSSLSSCPSRHHIDEEETDPLLPDASTAPGVVARLMGLESLPDIETNSVRRRSRRKSIPTYTEIQDDKFVILSFDQLSIEDSMKTNLNSAEKKQIVIRAKCKKKRIQEWNKENSEEDSDSDRNITDFHVRNSSYVLKNLCQKSHLDMKKKAKQELGIEDDSENSSPNSVLDVVEFSPDARSDMAGDHNISRLGIKSSKLRRTLSEELENYRKTAADNKKRLIKNGCPKEGGNRRSRVKNRRNNKSANNEIGILAARETVKSNWLEDKTQHHDHHYKDMISRDLASEIFHQLLAELLIINN